MSNLPLKSGRTFALFSLFSILFFALFFFYITGYRGSLGTFRVDDAFVCVDVDDSAVPWGVGDRFGFGVRQLCLLLDYSGGEGEDMARFRWYFKDQLVHEELQVLDHGANCRMFYILREDGSPLPAGTYEVRVDVNGRMARRIPFSVVDDTDVPANSQREE